MDDQILEEANLLKAEIDKFDEDLVFLNKILAQWSAAEPDVLVSDRLQFFYQRSGTYLETLVYLNTPDFNTELVDFTNALIVKTTALRDAKQTEFDNLCDQQP
jgi:hypothetical protein